MLHKEEGFYLGATEQNSPSKTIKNITIIHKLIHKISDDKLKFQKQKAEFVRFKSIIKVF